jgi:hypothetical protein
MKKIRILMISAIFMLTGLTATAQNNGFWNFQYDMGFGLGNTHDFISAASFRGASLEGRAFVNDHLTVGGRIAFQTFYKNNGYVTRKDGTTTTSGYNKRYINAVPVMATAHYYFTTSKVYSYAGLGVGTYYLEMRDQMGIFYTQDKSWRFGLSPDVGVMVPFGKHVGLTVNLRYNFAAKTKDSPGQSWLGAGIGLSYAF